MQAKPNSPPVEQPDSEAPAAAPSLDVADAGMGAHASPARALQARLVRELAGSNPSWIWHSTGLVLVAILSMWAAGHLLSAQI